VSGSNGITAVPGIRVGHWTDIDALTGCTVVLCEAGAVGAVEVRGGAPGTRETDLLRPEMMVQEVHGVLLTGGSAFGLAAADGVMRYLEERGVGFDAGVAKVPIVPAAVLFDLAVGDSERRPDADTGYAACLAAGEGAVPEGQVGAGTGATVGKLLGPIGFMRGGIGSSAIELSAGVVVGSIAAVNAFGDILDENGRILAGTRTPQGDFLDTASALLSWEGPIRFAITASESPAMPPGRATNTTLAVVATNAGLTKSEATRVAQLAHDGLARVISPSHTLLDGDVIFVLSTGRVDCNPLTLGIAAARTVAESVIRGVRVSNGLLVS
jgi:L-aminopeptidase/D-esterase-like protein